MPNTYRTGTEVQETLPRTNTSQSSLQDFSEGTGQADQAEQEVDSSDVLHHVLGVAAHVEHPGEVKKKSIVDKLSITCCYKHMISTDLIVVPITCQRSCGSTICKQLNKITAL